MLKKLLFAFILLIFLAGCVDGKIGLARPKGIEYAVDEFIRETSQARSRDLHLLAPEHFARTKAASDKLSQMVLESKDTAEISNTLEAGRQDLKKAYEVSEKSQKLLSSALRARQELLNHGAREFNLEVWAVDLKLMNLAQAVENGQIDQAIAKRDQVARDYYNLDTPGSWGLDH